MNRKVNLIGDIITKYETSPKGTELEIRFKHITKDTFNNIYQSLLNKNKSAEVSRTLNLIKPYITSQEPTTKIYMTKDFDNNTMKYYNKTPIAIAHEVIGQHLTINISREMEVEKFSIEGFNAHFKLRASFPGINPDWRIDLTLIRENSMAEISNVITKIKEQFFDGGFINNPHAIKYSVEIEHIGKSKIITRADIINNVQIILDIIGVKFDRTKPSEVNPGLLTELRFVSQKIGKYNINSIKKLLNSALSMNKAEYQNIYPPLGYYLTEKADGLRCLMVIRDNKMKIITHELTEIDLAAFSTVKTDTINNTDELNAKSFDAEAMPTQTVSKYEPLFIADCEMIVDKSGRQDVYIFDILYHNDIPIYTRKFSERVEFIKPVCEVAQQFILSSQLHLNKLTSIKIVFHEKTYTIIKDDLEKVFKSIYEKKVPYDIDGLILTSPDKSYFDTSNYKWKPLAKNTIDFLAKECPQLLLGKAPHFKTINNNGDTKNILYILFCGITGHMQNDLQKSTIDGYEQLFPNMESQPYHPIQFSSSIDYYSYMWYAPAGYDGKIVELRKGLLGSADNTWKFIKIREDRDTETGYYGNDFRVAELTYFNYLAEFKFEDLYRPNFGYFENSSRAVADIRYRRYAIGLEWEHMAKNTDTTRCMDLAAGRGADLKRFRDMHCEQLIAIDIDPVALSELIRRRFTIAGISLDLHIIAHDLNTPVESTLKVLSSHNITAGTTGFIACNYAFHYFAKSLTSINNIAMLIKTILKIDGIFGMVVMSGNDIDKLLSKLKKGEKWIKLDTNGGVKYEIIKEYSDLLNIGQMIKIKLPLANQYYEEPLVNIERVAEIFRKHKLELETDVPLGVHLSRYIKENPDIVLTQDDIEYINLHHFVTFRKIAK